MKKLLLGLFAAISFSAAAQEPGTYKVSVDVNKELYPIEMEDSYMSSNMLSLLGVTYMDGDFANAETTL